jgi:uncharacterized protein YciI
MGPVCAYNVPLPGGEFMKYVSYAKYINDNAKIIAHRPAHRDYVRKLHSQGKLAIAGPFSDDSGGLFIYEVDSAEAGSAIVAEDPFSINGVYEKVEIKPWTLVFSNVELFRTNT